MELERFDEALEVIKPYSKSLPEKAYLKELEDDLQKLKKDQDELFRYDLDHENDVDREPLG
jgi:hypothetical protein